MAHLPILRATSPLLSPCLPLSDALASREGSRGRGERTVTNTFGGDMVVECQIEEKEIKKERDRKRERKRKRERERDK